MSDIDKLNFTDWKVLISAKVRNFIAISIVDAQNFVE